MEIKLKNYLINTLNNGNKIYFVPMEERVYKEFIRDITSLSDQHSVNKFIDKYGFKHSQVILDGETYINGSDNKLLEQIAPVFERILPYPKTVHNPINNHIEKSYKCFCCDTLNIEDVVEHKTFLSSWNCLMISLGEPQYGIVVEFKKEK